jgi:hypothetical protein
MFDPIEACKTKLRAKYITYLQGIIREGLTRRADVTWAIEKLKKLKGTK